MLEPWRTSGRVLDSLLDRLLQVPVAFCWSVPCLAMATITALPSPDSSMRPKRRYSIGNSIHDAGDWMH